MTAADRAFAAVGVNVTLIVQVPFTATVAGQLFVCAKSPGFVPPSAMPVIASGFGPALVSVIA
jgi:hypothetical protein